MVVGDIWLELLLPTSCSSSCQQWRNADGW